MSNLTDLLRGSTTLSLIRYTVDAIDDGGGVQSVFTGLPTFDDGQIAVYVAGERLINTTGSTTYTEQPPNQVTLATPIAAGTQVAFVVSDDSAVTELPRYWEVDGNGDIMPIYSLPENSPSQAMGDLNDVDLSGLTIGNYIEWDGAKWAPQAPGGGVSSFTGLSDTPNDYSAGVGFVPVINGATSELEFVDPITLGSTTVLGLTDTPGSFGTTGQVLTVNGPADALIWATPAGGTATFLSLTDTPGSFGTVGQVAVVNASTDGLEWATNSATVASLDDVGDVTITGPTSSDVIQWSGSAWVDRSLAEAGISATHGHPYASTTHQHDAGDIDSGTLQVNRGGTNQSTYAQGDILYAPSAGNLARLSAGSNDEVLTLAGGVPTWATTAGDTPGGSNTQLQYNNAGSFDGMSELTYQSGTGIRLEAGKDLQIGTAGKYIRDDGGDMLIGTGNSTFKVGNTNGLIELSATGGRIFIHNTNNDIDIGTTAFSREVSIYANATGSGVSINGTYVNIDGSSYSGADFTELTDGSQTTLHTHAGAEYGGVELGLARGQADLTAGSISDSTWSTRGTITLNLTASVPIMIHVVHFNDSDPSHFSDFRVRRNGTTIKTFDTHGWNDWEGGSIKGFAWTGIAVDTTPGTGAISYTLEVYGNDEGIGNNNWDYGGGAAYALAWQTD